MKNLLILILVSTFYCAGAQTGKFRTLNYFVRDSANVYRLDSFDHVNVTISVHPDRITLIHNKTQERKDFIVERFGPGERHLIAYLANGETFHYQIRFRRVYFASKDFKTYTQYKKY